MDGVRYSLAVCRLNQVAGLTMCDYLRYGSGLRSYDRRSLHHCLNKYNPESFRSGGMYQNVSGTHEFWHIITMSKQMERTRNSELTGQRIERIALGAIPCDQQMGFFPAHRVSAEVPLQHTGVLSIQGAVQPKEE